MNRGKIILSILIPTIEGREHFFRFITNKLSRQIIEGKFVGEVIIQSYKDKRGEATTGAKRNELIKQAKGDYLVFVDDDDNVSEYYVKLIMDALAKKPDSVSFWGTYSENGGNEKHFVISTDRFWEEDNGVFYRYINHLCPVKKTIAEKIGYPDKTIGEDYDYMERLQKSGLIKNNILIQRKLYFYEYRSKK